MYSGAFNGDQPSREGRCHRFRLTRRITAVWTPPSVNHRCTPPFSDARREADSQTGSTLGGGCRSAGGLRSLDDAMDAGTLRFEHGCCVPHRDERLEEGKDKTASI